MITVGIALYRVILASGSPLVSTVYQRKKVEHIITLGILVFPAYHTGGAVYFRDDFRYFAGIII